jgi:GNAT superfamily N-acetyltransferase
VNGAAPGRIRVEPVRREWADPCRTATQSSPNGSPCPLRKTGQASQALPIIIAAAQGDEQDQWGPHLFFGDDGALIGNGGWKGPPVDGVAELGYAVAPARQGRGVATAVVRELVRRARVAGLRMVVAHTRRPSRRPRACSRDADSQRWPSSSTPTKDRFGVGSITSNIRQLTLMSGRRQHAVQPPRPRGDAEYASRKFGFILWALWIPISPFCAPPLVISAAATAAHSGGSRT